MDIGFTNAEELFRHIELPPFHTSFFWPEGYEQFASQQVDWESLDYLPDLVKSLTPKIVPVLIEGDGNCLLRAISFSLWGLQDYHVGLRLALCEELQENLDWYKKSSATIESDDWDKALEQAQREGDYLGFTHVFAIANILKRAIVVYASDNDVANYGEQESGVSGTFLPSRVGIKYCFSSPVIPLTWSSQKKNHFLPLVVFERQLRCLPDRIPEVAFQKTIENFEDVQYYLRSMFELDFTKPPERIHQLREIIATEQSYSAPSPTSNKFSQSTATNLGSLRELLALDPNNPILQTLLAASTITKQNQNRSKPVKVYYRDAIHIIDLNSIDNFNRKLGKTMQTKLLSFYLAKQKSSAVTRKSNQHDFILLQSTHADYMPLGRLRYQYFPNIKQIPYKRADDIRKAYQFIISKSGIKFSAAQIQDLDRLVSVLESPAMEEREFSPAQLLLVSYMLSVGETKSIFAVLDVVRLMILHPQAIRYFASRMSSVHHSENLLSLLFRHISNLSRMDDKTRKSVYQLAFMMLTNMFSAEEFFPCLREYASTIMLMVDQAMTSIFRDASPNYDLTNRCAKIVACLSGVMEDSPRVNKFQLVFLIVKFLGRIHGSRDNYLESASNLIAALASLVYADSSILGKLLDVHIRWPINDVIAHATTLDLSQDPNYERLTTIIKDFEDVLARPVYVPKKILQLQF
jgi:hypothetical protein